MNSATATHEAGHAVASYVLGHTDAGPVSVAYRGTFAGMCFTGYPQDDDSDIIATLAGTLATELLNPFHLLVDAERERLKMNEGTEDPEALAAMLEALPPNEAAHLAASMLDSETRSREDREQETDDEHVMRLLMGGIGSSRAEEFERLQALTARTRELLTSHADAVRALADHLDQHGTLSRDQWHAVLAAAGLTPGEAVPATATAA